MCEVGVATSEPGRPGVPGWTGDPGGAMMGHPDSLGPRGHPYSLALSFLAVWGRLRSFYSDPTKVCMQREVCPAGGTEYGELTIRDNITLEHTL